MLNRCWKKILPHHLSSGIDHATSPGAFLPWASGSERHYVAHGRSPYGHQPEGFEKRISDNIRIFGMRLFKQHNVSVWIGCVPDTASSGIIDTSYVGKRNHVVEYEFAVFIFSVLLDPSGSGQVEAVIGINHL
jgi:hypothetical protein